jgi:Integral membrane protein TerC family
VLHDATARGDCLDSHQFGTRAGAIPPSIAGSIEPSSQPTPARTYGHQCGLVRREGQLVLTPLALALIMIETSDLIFALDSIPAIVPITCDSFLGFTSNIGALLSLRSRLLRTSRGRRPVSLSQNLSRGAYGDDRDEVAVERRSR